MLTLRLSILVNLIFIFLVLNVMAFDLGGILDEVNKGLKKLEQQGQQQQQQNKTITIPLADLNAVYGAWTESTNGCDEFYSDPKLQVIMPQGIFVKSENGTLEKISKYSLKLVDQSFIDRITRSFDSLKSAYSEDDSRQSSNKSVTLKARKHTNNLFAKYLELFKYFDQLEASGKKVFFLVNKVASYDAGSSRTFKDSYAYTYEIIEGTPNVFKEISSFNSPFYNYTLTSNDRARPIKINLISDGKKKFRCGKVDNPNSFIREVEAKINEGLVKAKQAKIKEKEALENIAGIEFDKQVTGGFGLELGGKVSFDPT